MLGFGPSYIRDFTVVYVDVMPLCFDQMLLTSKTSLWYQNNATLEPSIWWQPETYCSFYCLFGVTSNKSTLPGSCIWKQFLSTMYQNNPLGCFVVKRTDNAGQVYGILHHESVLGKIEHWHNFIDSAYIQVVPCISRGNLADLHVCVLSMFLFRAKNMIKCSISSLYIYCWDYPSFPIYH